VQGHQGWLSEDIRRIRSYLSAPLLFLSLFLSSPVIFYCFLPTECDPPPPPLPSCLLSLAFLLFLFFFFFLAAVPSRCSFYIDSPSASIVTRARVSYPYRFSSFPPSTSLLSIPASLSLSLSLLWIARIRGAPLLLPLLSLPRMRERAQGL